MKRIKLLPVAIVLIVVLTLSAGLSAAQGPALQGQTSPQTMVGSAFTYQGQLLKDGNPINAICTMGFRLYDDLTAGNLVGVPITTTVDVAGGLFTVPLDGAGDFGPAAFSGEARWLEVAVKCPGDAAFSTLAPRQALTAAPYALSLRPGAIIEGAVEGSNALVVVNRGASGNGVWGQSDATNGAGVRGWASATAGTNYGVYGRSDSTDGQGVSGYATAITGTAIGASGQSDSFNGIGVYGLSSATSGEHTYGVYGESNSYRGVGVYGLSNYVGGEGTLTYGVFGEAQDAAGTGVYGYNASGTGVRGESDSGVALSGVNYFGTGTLLSLSTLGLGDLIVAYSGLVPHELRFRVDNAGNVYADGQYITPIPGFAQMLPGPAGLEIGDVLVVGPDGALARCDTAFQPTVVGVFAPQAGLISGKAPDTAGQVPLAVVGVVTVKVSAENGPIVPGDLLVAAATPGHAMRAGANPPLGTVIGKALGSLDKDSGTLLMLVMLR